MYNDRMEEVKISMAEARMAIDADFCFLRLDKHRKLMFESGKVIEMLLAEDPETLLNRYDRNEFKKLLFFGNPDGIWYGDFDTHSVLMRKVLVDKDYSLKSIGKPPKTKEAVYTTDNGDVRSGTLLFPGGELKEPLVSFWTRDSDALMPLVIRLCHAEGLKGTLTVEHNKTNQYSTYSSEVTTHSL